MFMLGAGIGPATPSPKLVKCIGCDVMWSPTFFNECWCCGKDSGILETHVVDNSERYAEVDG